ncbi:minor capsid protein [Streptococcus danieliae]|uniref:Minor capsid protein n=1 Tax=Streptococcus danieliae TaxID=747656 RepID=A0A7Z0M6R5_9STRE|nr:minor capsid protein [Streptococcus danieliae]MBF0699671.1 minor capsid protein [Streptococcus danieliae]NYS96847.1 minor capsid protein [Streptococcus danieliae]
MLKKNHQDYWTQRVDEIIRYADQLDIDVFAEIAKIYLEEAKLVQKELFAFYQRFADDKGLTLQEAMYQLRHEDMSDYQQNAKRYFEQAEKDPELLKRLNEQYASARATRMDLLNLELTWRAGVLATSISSTFENHLLKTAKYAYRKAGDRRSTINEPALRELIRTPINGKNYSEHIWGNVDKLAEDLREVLRRGFIRGLNPREMGQEIAKKYNVARSRAQTIIRTDGTAIISNSVAKRYLDAGLKYYRILVHLDDRTTDVCRRIAKEDKLYELSEMKAGLNAPPFHYNCRSGIVPDEEELGGGKVSQVHFINPLEGAASESEKVNKRRKDNSLRVDRNLINSNAYRRKFDSISENSNLNRALYQSAKEILFHRDGTKKEDLYLLDLTGKVLYKNNVSQGDRSVSYTKSMLKLIREHDSPIITIHNHPSSMPPSLGDLHSQLVRGYSEGFIVGHNGIVFQYEVSSLKSFIPYVTYLQILENNRLKGYNEFESQMSTLKELSESFGFTFKEVGRDE